MLPPNKIQKKTKNSNFSTGVYETNYRGTQPGCEHWQ